MSRTIYDLSNQHTATSNRAMAGTGPRPPQRWIDVFPVVEVSASEIVIQADPVEPLDRRTIPRDQINGCDELVAGDWIWFSPEVLADPRNGLQP